MIEEQEKIYWLAWSKIKGIGAVSLKKIYEHFSSLKLAWETSSEELIKIEGIGKKLCNSIREEKRKIEPQQLYLKHLEKNPNFLTPNEVEYPSLLLEIPSPPAVLYYQGNLQLLTDKNQTPFIGIVGTRKPTEHGKKWTYHIAKTLAENGFTIVSGLAEGIDTVAHRGCLDGGGKTIAILGNGLDRVYPFSNRKLMQEIAEKGLILTEYDYGSTPERGNFPARNRIVAGVCRAILVIEAPEKSGALITARYGNEFNRDVYTLPDSPDNIQARGCLRLIDNGAQVIITSEELLASLGVIPTLDDTEQLSLFSTSSTSVAKNTKQKPILSSTFMIVYEAIDVNATAFDVIVEKSQLDSGEVSGILLQLELEGLVTQLPGMSYCK